MATGKAKEATFSRGNSLRVSNHDGRKLIRVVERERKKIMVRVFEFPKFRGVLRGILRMSGCVVSTIYS